MSYHSSLSILSSERASVEVGGRVSYHSSLSILSSSLNTSAQYWKGELPLKLVNTLKPDAQTTIDTQSELPLKLVNTLKLAEHVGPILEG